MIIEDKRHEAEVRFEILKEGDVFSYNDLYYMKIRECDDGINAIDLMDGEGTDFYSNHEVVKVNAKLVIE